ncbi:MAG: thiol-disulfide oxidoreductase DCC family protein [Actinomycetota bacterium]
MATQERTEIGKGLLIYDGDCGFCERSAAWLRRRLPKGYEIQPSHRLNLAELGLDRKNVHQAAYWIDPDGTQHRGHRAIMRAVESSGGILGQLARATKVWPIDPLASWVYGVVARNRHHLPGASDHCQPLDQSPLSPM